MRASQQVYDERRAQWEGKPAQSLKQAHPSNPFVVGLFQQPLSPVAAGEGILMCCAQLDRIPVRAI